MDDIKAVIFDLGGTIYQPPESFSDTHRRFLVEIGMDQFADIPDPQLEGAQSRGPDAWLDKYMLENNVDIHWEPSRDEWVEYDERLLRALGINENVEALAETYQKKWDTWLKTTSYTLLEGCKEVLEELHSKGYKLGVASNRFGDPSPFLKSNSILSLFESIEYTAVPRFKKPAPYMLLKVAGDLGVNPRKSIYVGNLVRYDVEAAIRAEMNPVLITWCNPEEKEKAPKAAIIIEHINELLYLLK